MRIQKKFKKLISLKPKYKKLNKFNNYKKIILIDFLINITIIN